MVEIEIEIVSTDIEAINDILEDLIAIISDEIARDIDNEIMKELNASIIRRSNWN